MLSSISWQQYLAAVAIISTSYYAYVILKYYQRDMSTLFTSKASCNSQVQECVLAPISIMGQSRLDQNFSIVSDHELQFAENEEVEPVHDAPQSDPVNSKALSLQQQLFQQIDKLIDAFADSGSKTDFVSLLAILLNSYEQYQSEINFSDVARHIETSAAVRLPFNLTMTDLPKTWNQQEFLNR